MGSNTGDAFEIQNPETEEKLKFNVNYMPAEKRFLDKRTNMKKKVYLISRFHLAYVF